MNSHIFEFREILKQFPSLYGADDPENLLELLWSAYSSFIPASEPDLSELEPVLGQLSRKRSIVLLRIIHELRGQREKEAFCAGVRAGAQLMLELME